MALASFRRISTRPIVHSVGTCIRTDRFYSSNSNWNECRRCSRRTRTSSSRAQRPSDDSVVQAAAQWRMHFATIYPSHRNESNRWACVCRCRRRIRRSLHCMRRQCVCFAYIVCEWIVIEVIPHTRHAGCITTNEIEIGTHLAPTNSSHSSIRFHCSTVSNGVKSSVSEFSPVHDDGSITFCCLYVADIFFFKMLLVLGFISGGFCFSLPPMNKFAQWKYRLIWDHGLNNFYCSRWFSNQSKWLASSVFSILSSLFLVFCNERICFDFWHLHEWHERDQWRCVGRDNDTLRFEWIQCTRVRRSVIHIVNDLPVHAVTVLNVYVCSFIRSSALQFRMLRIPHSLRKSV